MIQTIEATIAGVLLIAFLSIFLVPAYAQIDTSSVYDAIHALDLNGTLRHYVVSSAVAGWEGDFGHRFDCPSCHPHNVPSDTDIIVSFTIEGDQPIGQAAVSDIFSDDWTVVNANGAEISTYNGTYTKLTWEVDTESNTYRQWYKVHSPSKVKPTGRYKFYTEYNGVIGAPYQVIVVRRPGQGCGGPGADTEFPEEPDAEGLYDILDPSINKQFMVEIRGPQGIFQYGSRPFGSYSTVSYFVAGAGPYFSPTEVRISVW